MPPADALRCRPPPAGPVESCLVGEALVGGARPIGPRGRVRSRSLLGAHSARRAVVDGNVEGCGLRQQPKILSVSPGNDVGLINTQLSSESIAKIFDFYLWPVICRFV